MPENTGHQYTGSPAACLKRGHGLYLCRMATILTFMDTEIWGNTLRQYAWLLGVILVVIIFNKYISNFISKLLFQLLKRSRFKHSGQLFLKLCCNLWSSFWYCIPFISGFRCSMLWNSSSLSLSVPRYTSMLTVFIHFCSL